MDYSRTEHIADYRANILNGINGSNINKELCKENGIHRGAYIVAFAIGVFIASVLSNVCFHDKILVDYEAYSILGRVQSLPLVSQEKLAVYLAERRSVQFLLFLLVMKMIPKSVQSMTIVVLSGLVWGIYSSVQSMCDGISGLLVGTIVLLPHWIFYMSGVVVWLKKKRYTHAFMTVFMMILCVCVGIGLEIYLQPNMLRFFALRFK